MDPVSLVVAALIAGATAAMKDVGTNAVKDVYAGLKSLVKRAFGSSGTETTELDKVAPDEAALEQEVRSSGVAGDKAVVAKAQELLELIDPDGTNAGKYRVRVTGGIVGVVGDHGTANIGMPPA